MQLLNWIRVLQTFHMKKKTHGAKRAEPFVESELLGKIIVSGVGGREKKGVFSLRLICRTSAFWIDATKSFWLFPKNHGLFGSVHCKVAMGQGFWVSLVENSGPRIPKFLKAVGRYRQSDDENWHFQFKIDFFLDDENCPKGTFKQPYIFPEGFFLANLQPCIL